MKEYTLRINDKEHKVTINSIQGKTASVTLNGVDYQVEISQNPSSEPDRYSSAPAVTQETYAPRSSDTGKTVTSPLPGQIIAVRVKVGDTVKVGQEVAVLEAMKMENSIEAEADGTVKAVYVKEGDTVYQGDPVVTIG